MLGPPVLTVDQAWHAMPGVAVLRAMGASLAGLSEDEVRQRQLAFGPNVLEQAARVRPLQLLATQFRGLLIWLLLAAAAIAGVLGEWVDCAAILAIVLLNAVIGFFQELRAEKSLAALAKMTAPQARVRRGERTLLLPAAEVVPGDVLELEAGDLVPADARLVESSALRCNEAALTGESVPCEKSAVAIVDERTPLAERSGMVFLGTGAAAGSGLAVVVATGMRTEIGRIAQLMRSAGSSAPTPLQERLAAFGRWLVWASLGVVSLVFLLGILRRLPAFDLFLTSVSLAVAVVPEGLPAVVTVALAVGVQRMARRRALIRKLHAVETLGCASVICSDKTGTLTVGEMTVRRLHAAGADWTLTGHGYGPEGSVEPQAANGTREHEVVLRNLLMIFAGCSTARLVQEEDGWRVIGDPTEGALLAAARKSGLSLEAVDQALPRLAECPFDSERKRMTMLRRCPGDGVVALVKGAPEMLLERCTHILDERGVRVLTEADRLQLLGQCEAMAASGMRVLAAGFRELAVAPDSPDADTLECDLTFVGLAGMHDPPRPEAAAAVARCRSAGIQVVMITGDHPRTALAIARDLGIVGRSEGLLSGPQLDTMPDEDLARCVPDVAGYARVTAEHKLRIIRAWKERGAVVAMTGDGVNDAPAIKGADIGIAMGRTGTEVAKEASDMVITDDNFASIVAAVEEGRGIYDNIRKTVQYLLAGNCGELLLMTVSVLLGLPLPLLPVQLLWINLVTDGLPALCLATDPIDPDVMRRGPRQRQDRLADRRFLGTLLLTASLTAGVTLAVYLASLPRFGEDMARAHAFSTLVFAELLRSLGARSATRTVWETGLLSNLRLLLVVAATLAIQALAPHIPWISELFRMPAMPMGHCAVLLLLAAFPLLVLEGVKVASRRRRA